MAIRFTDGRNFLVQVQRGGLRRTRRGVGTQADAQRIEDQLVAELEREQKLDAAAKLLGIERPAVAVAAAAPPSRRSCPTLAEFFEQRWVPHAAVVQSPSTQRINRCPWNYALYYLGERTLDDLLRPAEINRFIEQMKTNGPISFSLRHDGQPRRRQQAELTNVTINKSLQALRAALYLAHAEGVILSPPQIDLLPADDSVPVLPPTEEQYQKLLATAEHFRDVAPFMPEVIEFTAETGLRRAEVFHLTWGSVDLVRHAVRVEMQARGRVVNGRAWRPKHGKFREVPLSARALAVLQKVRGEVAHEAADLVFPNRSGAPYDRMDQVLGKSGKGFFFDVVEAAGLRGAVTFHGLRHLFAVRLLTRRVPITVVSELLGHSDINLTVKRYGRFSTDAKVKWDAVAVLDIGVDTRAPPAPAAADASAAKVMRRLESLDGGRKRSAGG